MPGQLLIPLLIVAVIAVSAAIAVAAAPRLPVAVRILAGLALAPFSQPDVDGEPEE